MFPAVSVTYCSVRPQCIALRLLFKLINKINQALPFRHYFSSFQLVWFVDLAKIGRIKATTPENTIIHLFSLALESVAFWVQYFFSVVSVHINLNLDTSSGYQKKNRAQLQRKMLHQKFYAASIFRETFGHTQIWQWGLHIYESIITTVIFLFPYVLYMQASANLPSSSTKKENKKND
jgi:hypothetical protein